MSETEIHNAEMLYGRDDWNDSKPIDRPLEVRGVWHIMVLVRVTVSFHSSIIRQLISMTWRKHPLIQYVSIFAGMAGFSLILTFFQRFPQNEYDAY